ncbi:MAG: hypothetical protein SLRJCFUN_001041, partial [Candidatus Fervidibacter sp.]
MTLSPQTVTDWLDRRFRLREHGSDVRTEIL